MILSKDFLLTLAQLVKEKREEYGLTQEELSEGICSRSLLAQLETAKIEQPSFNLVAALYFKLGLSLEELMKKLNQENNPSLKSIAVHINAIEEYLLDYRADDAYEYAKNNLDFSSTNYCKQIVVICECQKLFMNKKYQEAYNLAEQATTKGKEFDFKSGYKDLNKIRLGTIKFRSLVELTYSRDANSIIKNSLKMYTDELLELSRAIMVYPVHINPSVFIMQIVVLSELCRVFLQPNMSNNLVEYGELLASKSRDCTAYPEILIAKGINYIEKEQFDLGITTLEEAKNFASILKMKNKEEYITHLMVIVKKEVEEYKEKALKDEKDTVKS